MKVMVDVEPGMRMALESCPTGCPSFDLGFESGELPKPDGVISLLRRIKCNFCGKKTSWHADLNHIQMLWNTARFF